MNDATFEVMSFNLAPEASTIHNAVVLLEISDKETGGSLGTNDSETPSSAPVIENAESPTTPTL